MKNVNKSRWECQQKSVREGWLSTTCLSTKATSSLPLRVSTHMFLSVKIVFNSFTVYQSVCLRLRINFLYFWCFAAVKKCFRFLFAAIWWRSQWQTTECESGSYEPFLFQKQSSLQHKLSLAWFGTDGTRCCSFETFFMRTEINF